MKTFDRYLIRLFFPVFFTSLTFFVLLVELIDLFTNLVRYLAYEVAIIDIARVALLYTPKCITYAAPVSLLFAVSYVLGELYSKNELIVVFSSGIPLWRFTFSFIALGLCFSIISFQFENYIVISTLSKKNELSRELLRQPSSANEADIVVRSDSGKLVFSVDYYNDFDKTINGVNIVKRDDFGNFVSLIYARRGLWTGENWALENATEYRWDNNSLITSQYVLTGEFTQPPDIFKRSAVKIDEMPSHEAALLIQDLKNAGLPYNNALADYYRRFAFSATPFVVIFISVAIGGRFRKNVLLMSLLSSLILAVIYYVVQMMTMMFAKLGYLNPILGAWLPTILFVCIGLLLIYKART